MQARTEAEHMRQEVRRLESGLDRKTAQLGELQVRGFSLVLLWIWVSAVFISQVSLHAAGRVR